MPERLIILHTEEDHMQEIKDAFLRRNYDKKKKNSVSFIQLYFCKILTLKVTSMCIIMHYAMGTCGEWRCSDAILDLGCRWR
jgi:hypothetical protein